MVLYTYRGPVLRLASWVASGSRAAGSSGGSRAQFGSSEGPSLVDGGAVLVWGGC